MIVILLFLLFIFVWYGIDRYSEYKIYKNKTIERLIDIDKQLKDKEKEIKMRENDINRILNEKSQNSSWLAQRFIDYKEIIDNQIVEYLKNKPKPALKASEYISIANREKRKYCYEAKILKYQLDYLSHVFPMLEDVMQTDANDLETIISNINDDENQNEEYSQLAKWLTPEEYNNLSTSEKYQRALDRYLNRKNKTSWEIGISYERYIGYIYENKNYQVIYNGALEGFNDLGRDIIAENDKEILIIQCKYWKREKIIHENHIFQLYGTMMLKNLELSEKNVNKKVEGIFITTTSLSDTAKEVAKKLGIKVIENEDFMKDYPCIKCNINPTSTEKIYHLPFDQQYDRVRIEIKKGECYVKTVKEAEELGFRRALRHFYNNQ